MADFFHPHSPDKPDLRPRLQMKISEDSAILGVWISGGFQAGPACWLPSELISQQANKLAKNVTDIT